MNEGDQAIQQYRTAGTETERDEAARRLMAVVERIARQVARSLSLRWWTLRQLGQDLCDEAVGKVWQNLDKYDARQPPFERWCYRVLSNMASDLSKRKRPRQLPICSETEVELDPEDPRWVEDQQRLEHRLDAMRRFSPADLTALEQAPGKRRAIVLALSGLYTAVEPARWEGWHQECGFAPPFPPADMICEEEVGDRVVALAAHLAMRTDAVWRHWYRGLDLLRGLEYGQED